MINITKKQTLYSTRNCWGSIEADWRRLGWVKNAFSLVLQMVGIRCLTRTEQLMLDRTIDSKVSYLSMAFRSNSNDVASSSRFLHQAPHMPTEGNPGMQDHLNIRQSPTGRFVPSSRKPTIYFYEDKCT